MNFVPTKNKISSAVILCGGYNALLGPLTKHNSVSTLPLCNRPLIEYTIDFLKRRAIENIIISGSNGSDISGISDYLHSLKGNGDRALNIHIINEDRPRGTAGALRDVKELIGDDCFLVINGNTFVHDVDVDGMLAHHYHKGSAITIGVKKTERLPIEGISVGDDDAVKGFFVTHSSRERRSLLRAVGVYIFDPVALRFINDSGYFDIKEQLIPALRDASLAVRVYEVNGGCSTISSIEDYFDLHKEYLLNGFDMNGHMIEVDDGVWVGHNVSLSAQAYISGPVIIGSNCKIDANTHVIGPAVIGDNCTVKEGARVRESIIWSNVVVGKNANIRYCIAGQGVDILAGGAFNNKVLMDNLKTGDINLIPSRYKIEKVAETGILPMSSLRCTVFLGVKRFIDILVASVGLLVLFSPVMLLIAIAIKTDSRGPVMYGQQRCGRNGRKFKMLKFRTMVKNADSLQQELASKKDTDGPMFKLLNDPRVTRVGKFLRKTSLDELPQLINVLKGEMSLVGPRPLVMDEMKFSPSWRSTRLRVKPGITGLWQVQGRNEAPFHDWIRYDVYYVKNQSLWMDIKILFKTIKVVLKKAGAY